MTKIRPTRGFSPTIIPAAACVVVSSNEPSRLVSLINRRYQGGDRAPLWVTGDDVGGCRGDLLSRIRGAAPSVVAFHDVETGLADTAESADLIIGLCDEIYTEFGIPTINCFSNSDSTIYEELRFSGHYCYFIRFDGSQILVLGEGEAFEYEEEGSFAPRGGITP